MGSAGVCAREVRVAFLYLKKRLFRVLILKGSKTVIDRQTKRSAANKSDVCGRAAFIRRASYEPRQVFARLAEPFANRLDPRSR